MKREYKPQYQIIRTEHFISKSQELRTRFNRVPELIQAIDWALMRRPHHFTPMAGEFYLLKTEQLSNQEFPQVKVVYIINDEENTVTLLDIKD